MDRYLLEAKAGLLRDRLHPTRRTTHMVVQQAEQDGGIRYLSNLGSQNAIPKISEAYNVDSKKEDKNVNINQEAFDKAKQKMMKPTEEGTTAKINKEALELAKDVINLEEERGTSARISTSAIREVKERKKEEEAKAEKEASETAKKPSQEPPFLVPEDNRTEFLYGKYLRTRYPGAVGMKEMDEMMEDDIAFSVSFHYCERLNYKIREQQRLPSDEVLQLVKYVADTTQTALVDLAKKYTKEIFGGLIKPPEFSKTEPPEEIAEEVKKQREIQEMVDTKVYQVKQSVITKLEGLIQAGIDKFQPSRIQTKQDNIHALQSQINSVLSTDPKWRAKFNHYSKWGTGTEMSQSEFEKSEYERKKKEAEETNKRNEELNKKEAEERKARGQETKDINAILREATEWALKQARKSGGMGIEEWNRRNREEGTKHLFQDAYIPYAEYLEEIGASGKAKILRNYVSKKQPKKSVKIKI